jgi:hypothetical protein
MLIFGLMTGMIGALLLGVAIVSDEKWDLVVNAPICLALFGAAGMWLYFGVRLLRKRWQIEA